jgi:hypothetical protein
VCNFREDVEKRGIPFEHIALLEQIIQNSLRVPLTLYRFDKHCEVLNILLPYRQLHNLLETLLPVLAVQFYHFYQLLYQHIAILQRIWNAIAIELYQLVQEEPIIEEYQSIHFYLMLLNIH